ncbi:hypothetical protein GW819_02895 [Candidatus Gracilibacteria bacterium]|nr:hypothetical protein [Candidatus Gracilibacteria bacterium]PIQ11549.1 MAG: hypothetical protein COW68_02435 [Candidatus Gracilibacteria bacterium CG18_big_fil_WC_8_21_14_2_50_38_16]PIQ42287.1 MAG: hypothetical protein COW06_00065 [Candidatus Gracilibacteria bacterium CG12_big_fil_rev_8_21_14_0_65_38_15]
MSHEQKDSIGEIAKKPVSIEQHAGILKNKEKTDLENQIVDTLKSLNSHMTKKEILALIHRIEVGKGLEGLRGELEKEKKLEGAKISDEALQDIMNLFREIERVAESGLQELKLEISRLNVSKEYTVDKAIYLSSKFPWIKKLEDSKLGENIVIDLAGITIGALDSAHAIVKFLLILLGDLVMLPKHVLNEIQKK